MLGVELSDGPAKPPRWAFRGCAGKTRTFNSTAAAEKQPGLTEMSWNELRDDETMKRKEIQRFGDGASVRPRWNEAESVWMI